MKAVIHTKCDLQITRMRSRLKQQALQVDGGRRLTCYMSADWSEDEFIIRYDPDYRLWAIGSRRTGELKPCYLGCDDMMLRYVDLPADLLEFVRSAIRKDPNFEYYDDSVFDEKLI